MALPERDGRGGSRQARRRDARAGPRRAANRLCGMVRRGSLRQHAQADPPGRGAIVAAPGLVGGELLRLLARARHRRNLLVGKRRPPRPARGARVRRGAGDRDDVVVTRRRRAEPRVGDRHRRRGALDRRRVDPERHADPDSLAGTGGGRRCSTPVRLARGPAGRGVVRPEGAGGLSVPDRPHRRGARRVGRAAPADRRLGPLQPSAEREGAARRDHPGRRVWGNGSRSGRTARSRHPSWTSTGAFASWSRSSASPRR